MYHICKRVELDNMYPQNPKGCHKYAPPPPMYYPSLPPPMFPGNAMQPFPFPYPPMYGNCTGNGDSTAFPEMGIIPYPNKNVWAPLMPPSPQNGTGAYGYPAAPPSPGATSVLYLQRIGTGTGDGSHEIAWSTSLFGCLADFKSCLKTCFCPCVTSGQIAEIVSEGKTSCLEATIIHGLLLYLLIVPSIYTCHNRSKLRKRFKLKGNSFTDCLAHAFCCFCALCQEYRELYHQGYDPAIGWLKNVERDRNTVAVFRITTPPVTDKGMSR